jgi:hypothetical protein
MDGDIELRVNMISGSLPSEKPARKKTKLSRLKKLLKPSWICCLIVLLIIAAVALSITQVIIGVLYKDACPIEYLIPIYLIVSGCIGMALVIIIITSVSTFFDQYLVLGFIRCNHIIFCRYIFCPAIFQTSTGVI